MSKPRTQNPPPQPVESGIHNMEGDQQAQSGYASPVDRGGTGCDEGSCGMPMDESKPARAQANPEADSDAQIEDQVQDRLSRQSGVQVSSLHVNVNQGDVILSGKAQSHEAKRAAQDAVEGIDGVRNVDNQIEVEEAERAHDEPEEAEPVVHGL